MNEKNGKKDTEKSIYIKDNTKKTLYQMREYGETYSDLLDRLILTGATSTQKPKDMGLQQLKDEARTKQKQATRAALRAKELIAELTKREASKA